MELYFDEPPEQPWVPPPARAAIAIQMARAMLNAPPPSAPIWPVLAAAGLAAASALGLALAVIVGLPKIG